MLIRQASLAVSRGWRPQHRRYQPDIAGLNEWRIRARRKWRCAQKDRCKSSSLSTKLVETLLPSDCLHLPIRAMNKNFALLILAVGILPSFANAQSSDLGALQSLHVETARGQRMLRARRGHALIITGNTSNGQVRDFTHAVQYDAAPKGLVAIDKTGYMNPRSPKAT